MNKKYEVKTLLEEGKLEVYRYELFTEHQGEESCGYVLIKKGVNPEEKYWERLNDLALENLEMRGYMTKETYYDYANSLGIDLTNKEAIKNSELDGIECSDYGWRINRVEDYSNLDIYLNFIKRWD